MTLEKIEEIRRKRIKTYHVLDYILDSARNDEALHITGSYIYVLNLDGACSIRLNENSSDSIDLLKFRVINSPFYRFFLTHTAQAGKTMKIAVGVESEFFALQDFQSPDFAILTGYGQELRNNFSYNYGTQVVKSNSLSGILTVIIHTVTSGKTLLLEYAFLNLTVDGAGESHGILKVRDAFDVDQYSIIYLHGYSSGSGRIGSDIFQGIISIPAGYDICIQSTTSIGYIKAFIKGREI